MIRFLHDDDWGDWMHEQRKDKALDKRWAEEQLALHHDLAHRDIDVELERAMERSMQETDADRWADALDRAMGRTYSDDTETCQRCGQKGRPPCPCSTPDSPTKHPDTGWTML